MKKALKIIGISLLVAFGIFVLVSFIVNKDGTMYWINYVVDLLNKPLPIVGVTTTAVLFFVWQIIVKTNYGKGAINELKNEYQVRYDELKTEKDKLEQEREENKEEIEKMRECIIYLCDLIPNKKVNDLGDKFAKGLDYGETKETTNSETKAD